MSYTSLSDIETGVCASDDHCAGAKVCCEGACADLYESICADHPYYQGGYGPPPEMPPDEPPGVQPNAPPAQEQAGVGGKVLVAALVVSVVGGGLYLLRRAM